ncbi:hypothetical protein R4P64_13850 [Rhodococcus sp. IEGM 1366]|uniref:hypothetical protein n=1 Tax=Rhodococcus sp. IEGM 1366 TaxID=3082223 RepID=UPI002952AC88|nr:hypothetical protein [Rhodococcus sp. IEGM 1366]MDV8067594.1 hypothetical protein [Rhodococcus sp. IEGM 1366]
MSYSQHFDARKILRDAMVDDRVFDDLIQAMLDYAVPPSFLGLGVCQIVEELNTQILLKVNSYIDSLDEFAIVGLSEYFSDGFDSPGQMIIEEAAIPFYSAIPEVVLDRGCKDSRVFAEHPDLFAKLDKYGLVPVNAVDGDSQIGRVDGHMVHYHQLLRRSYVGRMNTELIEEILRVEASHPSNIARIALDERRLMPADHWLPHFEKDHVFGPRNMPSEGWLDDLHSNGTVVKGDFDQHSGRAAYDYAIVRSESRIDGSSNIFLKHIEVEERVSENWSRVDGKVLIRYFHSIRDPEISGFVHCDGAVKVFEEESYADLLRNQACGSFGLGVTKNALYRKVFRIDGVITTQQWSMLLLKWFRGNDLIREFLEGGDMAEFEPGE